MRGVLSLSVTVSRTVVSVRENDGLNDGSSNKKLGLHATTKSPGGGTCVGKKASSSLTRTRRAKFFPVPRPRWGRKGMSTYHEEYRSILFKLSVLATKTLTKGGCVDGDFDVSLITSILVAELNKNNGERGRPLV